MMTMSTATVSMTAVTPKAKLGTTNEEEGETGGRDGMGVGAGAGAGADTGVGDEDAATNPGGTGTMGKAFLFVAEMDHDQDLLGNTYSVSGMASSGYPASYGLVVSSYGS
jgi:hypothetical protein